jgi:hypothetical protein
MPRKTPSFDQVARADGEPESQELPRLDEAKMSEIECQWKEMERQTRDAWQDFLKLVRELPVDSETRLAVMRAAAKAMNLNSDTWVGPVRVAVDYMLPIAINQGKGRRLQHERTERRHNLIDQKLAEDWRPQEIYKFLVEHYHEIIKTVKDAKNMMRIHRQAKRKDRG